MRWRFVLTFALAGGFAPSISLAQSISLLSGEHSGFTRLAAVFPASTKWQVDETERGFEVRFSGSKLEMDLSRTFDRIGRERIQGLEFDRNSNTLTIESDCACRAKAFEAGRNTFAIDILDDPDRERRSKPTSLPFPVAEDPGPFRATPQLQPRLTLGIPNTAPSTVTLNPSSAFLDAFEQSLRQSVLGEVPDIASDANSMVDGDDTQGETIGDATGASAASQILVRQPGTLPSGAAGRSAVEACRSHSVFNALEGEDPFDFAAVLSAARRSFGGAQEAKGSKAVMPLTIAYLRAGFGREARATLAGSSRANPDHALLFALSKVVDDLELADLGPLARQEACDGPIALWAVLAQPRPDLLAPIKAAAVERHFGALPSHLRRHIGPTLAERLEGAGYPNTARIVRDATRRTSGDLPEALEIQDLKAAEMADDHGDPGAKLEVALETGTGAPEQVLLALLESQTQHGSVPDEDDLILAEALARELGNDPKAQRLLEFAALGRAAQGRPTQAFVLEKRAHDLAHSADREPRDLTAQLAQTLNQSLNDLELLATLLEGGLMGREGDIPDQTALEITSRLVDLGFATEASDLLRHLDDPESQEAVNLRAQVALDLQDPALAMALTAGRAPEEFQRLRARAHAALGSHGAAADLFDAAGAKEDAAHQAWLSGDGAAIRALGTEAQIELLDAMDTVDSSEKPTDGDVTQLTNAAGTQQQPLSPIESIEAPVPTLAESEALLAKSLDLRTRLAPMLAGDVLPIEETGGG